MATILQESASNGTTSKSNQDELISSSSTISLPKFGQFSSKVIINLASDLVTNAHNFYRQEHNLRADTVYKFLLLYAQSNEAIYFHFSATRLAKSTTR